MHSLVKRRLGWVAFLVVPMALASSASAQAPQVPKAPLSTTPAPSAQPSQALADLRKVQEQLSLENTVADLQLRKELFALTSERQKRELEAVLGRQRLEAEMSTRQAEIEKLNKQTEIINRRIALKEAERKSRVDDELSVVREKIEKLRNANDLATAELASKARELAVREQEVRFKSAEMQLRKLDYEAQIARINSEIDLREKRDLWHNRVLSDIAYTKDPFRNHVLTISDRRIALNGVITMDTADRITERINFFNNQNREFPIFIVIDDSPGGSVAAGYKILKTMKGSPSPVYVVVKSFAASMAAGITTLAARSFAYPNAIILHHQLSAGTMGNLTEHREGVKELEEWWRRLAAPVAAKMGVGLDEFIRRMYQNKSSGDWREFADAAHKLKWVDEVVEVIREDSYVKNPDLNHSTAPSPFRFGAEVLPEAVDANGKVFAKLPRLSPVDCYYLYNPDNYYRLTH